MYGKKAHRVIAWPYCSFYDETFNFFFPISNGSNGVLQGES